METPSHETKIAGKHPSPLRALKLAGFILVLLAVGLLIGLLLTSFTQPDTKQTLREKSTDKSLSYALHYPAKLPPGYKVEQDTITVDDTVANFTMSNETGNRLFVTQQKRPLLMEEVNKTREFNTELGKAYIADLNGRIAGFIVTKDTLIIISSSGDMDLNTLRQLIENMAKI